MKPFLLIADAEPILRGMFHLYLSTRGFKAETAVGTFDCLEKLRRLRPDVLILDRDLPDNGAAEVLAQMRDESTGLSQTPVILMSTSAFAGPDLIRIPIVLCLLKPFSLHRLADAADSALEQFRQELFRDRFLSGQLRFSESSAVSSANARGLSQICANFRPGGRPS